MVPLLVKHGEQEVYRLGMDALSYPPTLVDTDGEVNRVRAALNYE